MTSWFAVTSGWSSWLHPIAEVGRATTIGGSHDGSASQPNARDATMSEPQVPSEITHILEALSRGEPQAARALLPLVYEELRRLAARKLAREAPGQTLNATALVHEAYLRLVGKNPEQPWDGRNHFFAAAAESMRRILVENARRKRRIRHGGDLARQDIDDQVTAPEPSDELLAVELGPGSAGPG